MGDWSLSPDDYVAPLWVANVTNHTSGQPLVMTEGPHCPSCRCQEAK